MIKSLLDADENPPPETAVIIEETVLQPVAEPSAAPFIPVADAAKDDDILELPIEYQNASEIYDASASPMPNTAQTVETNVAEFKSASEPTPENAVRTESGLFGSTQTETFQPETTAETIRNSGLAYAAAVILLGSVIFMLILGWFADLLLGTSPWGIVVGIVLGSIIGFVQFFRTTSQILKK